MHRGKEGPERKKQAELTQRGWQSLGLAEVVTWVEFIVEEFIGGSEGQELFVFCTTAREASLL